MFGMLKFQVPKINTNREQMGDLSQGLVASVLIDAGSLLNARSPLNAGILRSVFK